MLPEQEAHLKNQIFVDEDGVAFNIFRLLKWAEQNCDLQEISVEPLRHEFESGDLRSDEVDGSPEFVERALKAGDFPIIVKQENSGVHWVMDGRHRLWKKIFLDRENTIKGYVISESRLPTAAIDIDECIFDAVEDEKVQ